MHQERWRRIDEIFHSALALDVDRRTAFLAETCSADVDLRLEVERLLIHYDEADSFLEGPAIEVAVNANRRQVSYPVMEGEMVSHYRVRAKLGSGGMGVVYEAEDLKLGRGVALKFLYDDPAAASRSIGRLQAEARAASGLNHPNICTIYAIEEHRGQPVLVMELLDGKNLRQRIEAGAVGTAELIGLAAQACDALGAAHAKGIVHLDIKPANFFVSMDGRLKLLDFGIAKWMRSTEGDRPPERIAGTIPYMSPEQLRGAAIDGRSDLFSLGLVLYELATGIRPFERSNTLLTMEAVLHDSVAAPSSLNPALPVGLDKVIAQMLEKDRERRYHTAADVSRDLERLRPRRSVSSVKWRLAVASVVFLLVCGLIPIFFARRSHPVLTDKDTLVLADFLNKTGDPVFNDTLRQGLAVELSQSPFLSLISDQRIQHVLRLMAKPPDTPLTIETARDVCERTESPIVLDGSISSLGKHYVLLLRAQNCRTGELLYVEQAEAARKEDVLSAISQMAGRFRNRAGEALTTITEHSTPLAEATTPSLEAWKSFVEGMKVGVVQGHAVAIPYIKRAIEMDPHFATAQAVLGRDYSALGEMELAREYTRRAFQERDRASDQERFFIDFSYDRLVTGNLEKAMETCELWTRVYPRDVLGHTLYGATAKALGLFEKTLEETKQAVEVDPDNAYAYVHLATVFTYQGNFAEAKMWLQRATDRKLMLPDFPMVRHQIAFLQEDKAEMERAGIASEHLSEIQDWIWGERAAVLAFSGRLKEARVMSERAVEVALAADRRESAAQHEAAAAVREALFGNKSEARRRAEAAQRFSAGRDAQYGAALAFGLTGDSSRLQVLANNLEQRYPKDTWVRFSFLPTLSAVAAMQRGKAGKAVDVLGSAARYELAWEGCCSVGFVGSLYPIYARGEAYLALHHAPEAAAEFQKIIDHRGIVGSDPIALLAHWRRGKALALVGKKAEAKAEYEHFLSLWREADQDVPILRRVKAEYQSLTESGG